MNLDLNIFLLNNTNKQINFKQLIHNFRVLKNALNFEKKTKR